MQDNMLFIFFKPPHPPTGCSSMMWIQMPEHTVCCKDIEFLWGICALWNLILTEFDFLLTLAQGRQFVENFIGHMCNLAWDVSIEYRFGADGVLQPHSMCQPCQYCHWVNPSAQPHWNSWTGPGLSHALFTASLMLLSLPRANSPFYLLCKNAAFR